MNMSAESHRHSRLRLCLVTGVGTGEHEPSGVAARARCIEELGLTEGPVRPTIGRWLTCSRPPSPPTSAGLPPRPRRRSRPSRRGRSQVGTHQETQLDMERLRHALMTTPARYRCRVLAGKRQESMNAERSLGAILMTFRIRTCASRPSPQSPYTVAVATPKCSATCLIESNRSGPPWLTSADPGPLVPRHKPDTKSLLSGASGGAEWELLSERFRENGHLGRVEERGQWTEQVLSAV
jgi:hypothetical protein